MSKYIVDIHGDIEGDYDIIEKYEEPKTDVLDKIRERVELEKLGYPPSAGYYKAIVKVLQIIDKYKTESGMTLEEFYKWLQTQPIEDKIVYIKYKYSWEKEWTYDNQILAVESESDTHYEWLTDWNEGQDDVCILGCMSVSEIDIPIFEESEDSE